MKQSAKYRANKNNDIVESMDWTPADNEIDLFIDEYYRLLKDGGPSSSTNYNLIESPGKKY